MKYAIRTLLFLLFILFVAGLFVFFIQDQKYSSIGSTFLSISSVLMVVITYIDIQDTVIKDVRMGLAGIGLFDHVYHFKPVYHSVWEEETDDKIGVNA